MTSSWYWVRDATTAADPESIARAATRYSMAHDSVRSAMTTLWSTDSRLGINLVVPLLHPVAAPQYMAELADLAVQIGLVLERIYEDLTILARGLQEHAAHLGMTALIYSSAEADVTAHIAMCRTLASVGCFAGSSGFTSATLLSSLPRYVSGMSGSQAGDSEQDPFTDPRLANFSGVEAQQQIGAITAGAGDGITDGAGVSALSARLSSLWRTLGFPPWARTSGVVVSGAGGVLWGGLNQSDHGSRIRRVNLQPRKLEHSHSSFPSRGAPAPLPVRWAGDAHPAQKAAAAIMHSEPRGILPVFAKGPKRLGFDGIGTPRTAGQLLARISHSSASGSAGQVQVLRHRSSVSGLRSWSVVISGTKKWVPRTLNPQDMGSNFQELAGEISDQHVSVRLAMELAGIQPDEPVEFVGHSQGGAVALSLAADPEVVAEYSVVSVLTAGAPTGPVMPGKVPVLALENLADIVPALDGRAALVGEHQQVVYFDAGGLGPQKAAGAHSSETYVEAANKLGSQSREDPALRSYREWEENRAKALRLGGDTKTKTLFFTTTRVSGSIGDATVGAVGLPGSAGVGTFEKAMLASRH